MFKAIVFAALLALAVAAPDAKAKPAFVAAAYTAPVVGAPVAYSAPVVAAPYTARYTAPYTAPVVSAYSAPAVSTYHGVVPPVAAYSTHSVVV